MLDLATLLVATFRVGTRLDAAVGLGAASIVLQQMTATTAVVGIPGNHLVITSEAKRLPLTPLL
jgi:serine acetyltransferase